MEIARKSDVLEKKIWRVIKMGWDKDFYKWLEKKARILGNKDKQRENTLEYFVLKRRGRLNDIRMRENPWL